jgi:hypothetical protein
MKSRRRKQEEKSRSQTYVINSMCGGWTRSECFGNWAHGLHRLTSSGDRTASGTFSCDARCGSAWCRGSVGFDGFQLLLVLLVGVVEVPSQLEVHPEAGGHSQELLQSQGGVRRHPPPAANDLVDPRKSLQRNDLISHEATKVTKGRMPDSRNSPFVASCLCVS